MERVHQPSEANTKWKEQIHNIRTIQRVCRIVWNWCRTNRVRVEYLPRIHIDWDSQTYSARSERSTNKSRSVWGKKKINVEVQWHWVGKGRKFWCMYLECPSEVSDHAKGFQREQWSFLGPGDEDKVVRNMQLQARRQMGSACQSNDRRLCIYSSSRIPRHKRAQPRNVEAKARTKHYFTSQRTQKPLS